MSWFIFNILFYYCDDHKQSGYIYAFGIAFKHIVSVIDFSVIGIRTHDIHCKKITVNLTINDCKNATVKTC